MKRALIITGDGLGNVVQATPTMRAFLQAGWKVDVGMPSAPEDAIWMLKGLGLDRITCHPQMLRGAQYDVVVPNFLTVALATQLQVGPVVDVPHPIKAQVMEAEGQFLASRGYHGIKEQPPTYCNYDPKLTEREGSVFVSFIMGSKTNGMWPKKRYPAPFYSMVARELLDRFPWLHVQAIGRGEDDRFDAHILMPKFYSSRVHEVFNQPLKLAVSRMKGPGITIGNDTGLTHISAALGTRTFMVLGPTEPRRSLPPAGIPIVTTKRLDCQPCQYHAVHGGPGMGYKAPGQECDKDCLTTLDYRQVIATVLGSIQRYVP